MPKMLTEFKVINIVQQDVVFLMSLHCSRKKVIFLEIQAKQSSNLKENTPNIKHKFWERKVEVIKLREKPREN